MTQLHRGTTKQPRQHNTITRHQRGFTIVELLIVIVVIAILAAISVAAYNGIQNRAHDTTVQSDVRSSYAKLLEYQAVKGSFPRNVTQLTEASPTATRSSYPTAGNNYLLCISDNAAAVVGRSKSGNWFYSGSNGSGSFDLAVTEPGNVQVCPLASIPTASPGYAYFWGYASSGPWQSWVK